LHVGYVGKTLGAFVPDVKEADQELKAHVQDWPAQQEDGDHLKEHEPVYHDIFPEGCDDSE